MKSQQLIRIILKKKVNKMIITNWIISFNSYEIVK